MYKKNIILWAYLLCVLCIPFFWWDSGFYLLGGDDLKYEYLDPAIKLNLFYQQNLFGNIRSVSSLLTDISGFPFYCILYCLKNAFPFINTQQLIYAFVLGGAFMGFYRFAGVLAFEANIQIGGLSNFYFRLIAANMYIFSPFLIVSMWSGQLPYIVHMATLPLILSLLTESTRLFSWIKILLASVLLTFSPSLYGSIPWVFPIIICASPIIFIVIIKRQKSSLQTLGLFFLVVGLLNFPTILASVSMDGYLNSQFSSSALQESIKVFSAVNKDINFLTVLGLIPSQNFLLNQLTVYEQMPIFFLILSAAVSFSVILLSAGTLLLASFGKNFKNRALIISLAVSALLSLLLFSGGGGAIGSDLLGKLMNSFPIFIMFRNTFDKFSIAVALFTSLWLYFTFTIIYQSLENRSKSV